MRKYIIGQWAVFKDLKKQVASNHTFNTSLVTIARIFISFRLQHFEGVHLVMFKKKIIIQKPSVYIS